jgi:hypothetical protein
LSYFLHLHPQYNATIPDGLSDDMPSPIPMA